MIKRFWKVCLACMLFLCASVPQVQADEQSHSLSAAAEVYRLLFTSHLSKPKEEQLVQGALTHVREQLAQSSKTAVSAEAEDDTYDEMIARLSKWQSETGTDWKTLNQWAIEGMVAALGDPYTAFFTAEELRRFEEDVENEAVGFGFRLRLHQGNLIVTEVVAASPAEQAGIQPGDYLFAIDGKKLLVNTLAEAYQMLVGDAGSDAVLTVYKPAKKRIQQFRLTRTVLTLPEVTGARFSGDVGYLRISTFGSETGYQFRDELARITTGKAPLKGLIVDLRDNGGGYLSSARDVAGFFMEEGLLMYTANRNGIEVETWVRNGREVSYPVRILVNEQTASASELLAGALRDHQVARLIGTKTFGKGVAQQIVSLRDGNFLKITLEEYITPNRLRVNLVGLTPDVFVEDEVAQVIQGLLSLGVKRIELREKSGELWINGVAFAAHSPVFAAGPQGVSMRREVLSSLTGEPPKAAGKYVPVQTGKTRAGTFQVNRKGAETLLVFTR